MNAAPSGPGAGAGGTALVLSGGCLRGFAQIGVLAGLARRGWRPDLVVGSSVGAVIGALSAAGVDPARLQAAALDLDVRALRRWTLAGGGLWSLAGLLALLERHLPHARIEDFPTRFVAVATERDTGRAALFDRGAASERVAASAAMPGFFVPQRIGGRCYVDGCLASPLPVAVARRLGAKHVIAVDTLPDPYPAGAATWLDRALRPTRMLLRALAAREAAEADLVIRPHWPGEVRDERERRHRAIAAGEEAVAAAVLRQ